MERYERHEAREYAREHMVGVWAAIPYPFLEDGELDEEGLRHDVDRMVTHGLVEGIFCGHFMSEFWALTVEERKRAAEIVISTTADRVPVVVQTGHHSIAESINLTRHAEDAGANFICLGNPYFMVRHQSTAIDYFAPILEATRLGVLISNTDYTGISLTPPTLAKLAEFETVVAIKNPQPLMHTLETKRLVGEDVIVSDPNESHWFMLMANFGFQLYMASPMPYLYQRPGFTPVIDYTNLVRQGELADASALSYSLEPLRRLRERWLAPVFKAQGQPALAYIKAWSGMLGMTGGKVRPPVRQVPEEELAELRRDLVAVGLVDEKEPALTST